MIRGDERGDVIKGRTEMGDAPHAVMPHLAVARCQGICQRDPWTRTNVLEG